MGSSAGGQSRRASLRHTGARAVFDAGVARHIQNRLAVLLEGLPGQDLSKKVRGVVLSTYMCNGDNVASSNCSSDLSVSDIR